MIMWLDFTKGEISINHVPVSERQPMQDVGGVLKPSGPKIVEGGYRAEKTKVNYSDIVIEKSYYEDLFSALSWACVDYLNWSFVAFKKVGNNTVAVEPTADHKGFISVECPGRFTAPGIPELQTAHYHQLIEDYRLLAQHYPDYRKLTSPGFDAKLSQVLFSTLISIVIENEKDATPPMWALRALAIKKEAIKEVK